MNRFAIALTLLIIIAMAMVGAVLFFGNRPAVAPDDGNLTARVIRIALADPGVAEATGNSYGKACFVTNVSAYGDDGRSGLIDSNATLLKVALTFGSSWAVGENRGLTVDMDGGKIVGREQYFRRFGPPYHESFIVPPGVSWYRNIYGAYYQGEGVKYFPTITFEPASARVYATVVNQRNLSLLMDGKAYASQQYVDLDTNRTSTCDRQLVASPWLLNMSIPDPRFQEKYFLGVPGDSYYIVLTNADPSQDVEMSYDMMRM